MPAQDAKSRQSSGGKSILGFMRKDKSNYDEIPSYPGSGSGSQSSRYSQRSGPRSERPLSQHEASNGLAANAGIITSIPYESVADGVSPMSVRHLPDEDRRDQLLPHHLNKGASDFHQYPSFDSSPQRNTSAAPPAPPPHNNPRTAMAVSSSGDRGVSMQQWGLGRASNATIIGSPYSSHSLYNNGNSYFNSSNPYAGDNPNHSRVSIDQASIHSASSGPRASAMHHQNYSQSTVSSFGGEQNAGYAPSTPGAGYRNTQYSMNGQAAYGQAPDGFNLPRPTEDHIIEQMFLDLMIKRGYKTLPEQARRQMEAYSIAKKWTLVYQDRLTEWQSEQKRIKHQSGKYGLDSGSTLLDRAHEEGSPEWYVRKVMDNSITPKQLQSLSVSLRTQPIGWVKAFVEAQGQIALTNVLSKINRRQKQGQAPSSGGTDKDQDREYDIVKCLKALMNNKYGADNALSHAQIVMALAGSLISPRLTTRKLVSDVLTFLCHWENGRGHEKVLNALDHLKSQQGETGRFDGWMRLVEVTVDGRGKMGSLVGASDEVRSGGIGMENLLMEYAVASMIFVNMLIDTPQNDLKLRCHIRAQFISCGIYRILTKMESFQYELLDAQIEKFHSNEAIDYEDLLERDDGSVAEGVEGEVKDMSDPVHIAEAIRNKIGSSDAYNPFVSSMQHMLVMLHQNDPGESGRVYKLVDAMLNYVATDRRLPDMDLKQSLNLTVQNVLDRLYTDSEARQATEDALAARQIADAAIAERDDTRAEVKLGADGLVGKLQKQVEEQQGVINLMNRHVDALKAEVAELQRLRAQELQRNELETRELYLMLRDAQDYAASAAKKNTSKSGGVALEPKEMQGILDREKLMGRLETQLERAKTRAKLEGKVWQQVTPSDRLRELREQMDGQLGQTEEELRNFEASYDQSFLGSVRASRGGPGGAKVSRKAVPGMLSTDVLDEGDEEEVVFEQAKMVDVSRPQKMPAALLGEIAARVTKDDGSDEEGGIPDGVTTGTTHPSIEADSPKTPADEKFDPHSDKITGAAASTLPGFSSNAPPPPPLPSNLDGPPGLAGFTSNAPPPPPPPPGMAGFGPPPPGMPRAPGLPAPPPPPLPGGKRGPGFLPHNSLPSSPAVPALGVARPKKKMKALHWEKVDTPQVTVWATHAPSLDDREERYRELSRKGVLDEVERLFLAKEIKKLGQSSKKNDKKSIISSDLSKNFQISMAKFSQRPVDDIVKLIIHCEPEILDNNVVMDFLQRDELCNIPENVAKLMAPYSKDWTGPNAMTTEREQDPSELTRPDQLYLFTAFELHHYWKARMRALALTRSYEADYDEISSKIRDIVNVSNSLRDSVTLLNVMSFILLIGNFMNEPNKQAAGFKISSLTRLGMVKDAANETTFLDFVERSVRNKWSEWDNFADDISAVTTAQKINVDLLIQDAKKYIDNIKNVQSSLDSGNLSDPKRFHPDDRVALVAQRSMKEARRKAEQLSLFLEEMTSTYNEIMAFFGEDPTDENERRNFLANFADFVRDWKKSKEKNIGLEETRRRNEASMKRKQPTLGTPGSGIDTPPSPSTSGAMDDLLAKLRAAKPEARDQRDRRRRARLKEKHAVRVASGQKMPDMADLVNPDAAEQENGMLSPTSEVSETASKAADEDAAVDIANQAANLLQGLGGKSDDEKDPSTVPQPSSSLRVRRRRENAEDERARRRQRRQQARSEISVGSTGFAEEGDEEKEDKEDDYMDDASQASPKKLPPPVTIVSPPSPEGDKRALPEIPLPARKE